MSDLLKDIDNVKYDETLSEKINNTKWKFKSDAAEVLKSVILYLITIILFVVAYIVIMGMPKFEPKEISEIAFLTIALFVISFSASFTWRKKAQFNAQLTKEWKSTTDEYLAICKLIDNKSTEDIKTGKDELNERCIIYRHNMMAEVQKDILRKYIDYDFFIKHLQSNDIKSLKRGFTYEEEVVENDNVKIIEHNITFSKKQIKAIKSAMTVTIRRLDSGVLLNDSDDGGKKQNIYIGRSITYYDTWATVKAVLNKAVTSVSYAYLGWSIATDFSVEKFKFFLMYCLSLLVGSFMAYDRGFQQMLTKVLSKTKNKIFYLNELGYCIKKETK